MNSILKKLILAVAAVLSVAAQAEEYGFLGFYDYKPPGEKCSSRAFETKPMASLADFKALEKAFKTAHPDPIHTICHPLKPDEATIVYEYRKKIEAFNCVVTVISHITASSVEQANELLRKRVEKEPKQFFTAPRVVFTWAGSPSRKSIYEEDYAGVRIRFTTGKTSSGTVVHAQGRNTNGTQAVLVELQAGGKTHRFLLAPGDSFNAPLGVIDSFEVTAQKTATPQPGEKSFIDAKFDQFKQLIRQNVTLPNGKFNPEKLTTTGVRG